MSTHPPVRRRRRSVPTAGAVTGWVLGALGDLLVTVGVVLLLFVGWQLWWTDVTANRDQSGTVQALDQQFREPKPAVTGPRPVPAQPVPMVTGEPFAILHIPRFGDDYARPIFEGTDSATLQKGVGHYPKHGSPASVGNFAIAGHRTTYGRPFADVDKLRPGDTIVVETKEQYSVYRVTGHRIVAPTAVEVIAPVPGKPGAQPVKAHLTMTACHPKYSAAQRYIVFAELVQNYAHAQGLPPGTLAAPKGA